MQLEQRRQAMLKLYLNKNNLSSSVRLILETWRYITYVTGN